VKSRERGEVGDAGRQQIVKQHGLMTKSDWLALPPFD
jgi:hypothetical protein